MILLSKSPSHSVNIFLHMPQSMTLYHHKLLVSPLHFCLTSKHSPLFRTIDDTNYCCQYPFYFVYHGFLFTVSLGHRMILCSFLYPMSFSISYVFFSVSDISDRFHPITLHRCQNEISHFFANCLSRLWLRGVAIFRNRTFGFDEKGFIQSKSKRFSLLLIWS